MGVHVCIWIQCQCKHTHILWHSCDVKAQPHLSCLLSVLIPYFISYLPWFPDIHKLPSPFSVWNTGIIHMCYCDQILCKILGIWTYVLLSWSKFFIHWSVTTALLNITYINYFIILSHSDSTLCHVLHGNYLSFVFSCIPQNIICVFFSLPFNWVW